MNRLSTFLICCLLCLSMAAFGQRIYVKAGGSGDGSSWAQATGDLRAALQTATSGTEVWVAQGSYYPTTCTNCSSSDRNLYFELRDNIQLYGGFEGTETQLSQRDWQAHPSVLSGDIDLDASPANNSYTIVYTHNVSETTILDGFFIQQGNAEDQSVTFGAPGNSGGGWYNDGSQLGSSSNPIIRNCTFRWNTAIGFGGAVYNDGCFEGEGNPILVNCTFEQNSAPQGGGGMYNNGSFEGICNPTYTDCRFISNTTTNSGAAIFNNGLSGNCSPIVNTTIFFDNSAEFYGGGLYNLGKEGLSSPKITNCLFNSNHGSAAGGIYNLGSEGGDSSPEITNCTFYGNVASVGACIYNQAGDSTGTCEAIVTNSIFSANEATSGFGFIFQNVYASPSIRYSMVQVNDCFELNTGLNGSTHCGSGMIYNQNPLFEEEAADNFRIVSGSPAIDGGDNAAVNAAVDLAGEMRIVNGTVDYGAYEYQASQYVAPMVIDEPQGQTICEGTATQLTMTVMGSRPLDFQWQKDGIDIPNAIDSLLAFASVSLADAGHYRCRIISSRQDTVWTQQASLEVTPRLPVSVTISSPQSAICEGETAVFNAQGVNGGETPIYQWTLNGNIIGTDSSLLEIDTLESTDIITCYLISSESCISGNPAVSESLSLAVNQPLTSTVTIDASVDSICAGTKVDFLASTTNGGVSPSFQWQRNGMNIGMDSPTFSSMDLEDGDLIQCQLTSSESCIVEATVESNEVAIVVAPRLSVGLTIQADADTICQGEMVAFAAFAVNGGDNPQYQWQINGQAVGDNTPDFSTDQLMDGDLVDCFLISSEDCILNDNAFAVAPAITIEPLLEPSIRINLQDTTSTNCLGDTLTFTTIVANGGDAPIYRWLINGNDTANDEMTFITDALQNGDQVRCIFETSRVCALSPTANSNAITVELTDCTLSTAQPLSDAQIRVSPNPAQDDFSLQFSSVLRAVSVNLLSLEGHSLLEIDLPVTYSGMTTHLNVATFPAGIYWLQIEAMEGWWMQKVVLAR